MNISKILVLISAYATMMLLSGCASAPFGRVTRYETNGQQTICWEPSHKLNGLAEFVANRFEKH